MQSLFDLTEVELKSWLTQHQEKPFRSSQLFTWIYQKGASSWEAMTDLSKDLRAKLSEHFSLNSLKFAKTSDSSDGDTTKFLWELSDNKFVESVLIRAPDRRTVCVSSQVGCPARCAFCASGKKGLMRNLSAGEIVEQVVHIDRVLKAKGERVSHVVFMGMGEPFENYENVLKAIHLLNDPKGLNISQRRMTVSTVGIVEQILRFAKEDLSVNLVLSLHAPNQNIRKKIIPYARKYDIADLLSAMLHFAKTTKRDITYEYTLMAGINDAPEHAQELASILQGHPCTVNLIPYNPVEGLHLKRPEKEVIDTFRDILVAEEIPTTWRYTKGKDIAAACGQLALKESSR
jgi:23S rRNA (adenine2503-C2)-methyltransferase